MMPKAVLRLLVLVTFIMMILPLCASAQARTGTLRGFVREEGKEPLPGVTIVIQSPNMMGTKTQITDANGLFLFLNIPPGIYELKASLQNFGDHNEKGIAIQNGKTTTIDILMRMTSIAQTVVVTASKPVIDTERSAKSISVNSIMLTNVPIAPRLNYSDIWSALPGVAVEASSNQPYVNAVSIAIGQQNQSYLFPKHMQDESYEQKITVDGMDFNDSMSGLNYAQFNYDAIEETDIKTAGAPAEFGNSRAAFMSIVTKSGGNIFHGDALLEWAPNSFNWTNIPGGTPSKTTYLNPGITLGGPIVRDRLWFLASYKYNSEDYRYPLTLAAPKIVRTTRQNLVYFKLSSQLSDNQRLSLAFQYDQAHYHAFRGDAVHASSDIVLPIDIRGGPTFILNWDWTLSSSLLLDVTAGYNHKPRYYDAQNNLPAIYYYTKYNGTLVSIAQSYGENYTSSRDTVVARADLTWFNDNFLKTGAHQFKIGFESRPYQYTPFGRSYNVDQNGYYYYYYGLDYADYGLTQPYLWQAGSPTPTTSFNNDIYVYNYNAYARDIWTISKNLSLSYGIRWESNRMVFPGRDQFPAWMEAISPTERNNVEFDDRGFAPRIGLTYNLENIGTFKLHFGKYFEFVGTGDYPNYAKNVTFSSYRITNPSDWGKGVEALQLYSSGNSIIQMPDYTLNLKMEYDLEFLASYERQLPGSLVFDVTYVYKNYLGNQAENVNPIYQDGKFVGYRFPDFDTIWQETTYEGSARRQHFHFNGLEFNLRRNFTARWGFMINYSHFWRNFKRTAWDPGDPYQFVYSSPSDVNEYNYGVTWSFHVSAFYVFPWGIQLSTFVTGQSGEWENDISGNYGFYDSAPRVILSNGRKVGDIAWSALNSYYKGGKFGLYGRYTDPIWRFNVRLQKQFKFSKYYVNIAIDFFNILNSVSYGSWLSNDVRSPNYSVPSTASSPRAAQMSLRFGF
jgi:hypothetical protein